MYISGIKKTINNKNCTIGILYGHTLDKTNSEDINKYTNEINERR